MKDSTMAQCFLAEVLSEDNFLKIKFLHHPLLLGDAGEKLSKSAGSISLKTLRKSGLDPENFYQTFKNWLNLDGESTEMLLLALRQRLS